MVTKTRTGLPDGPSEESGVGLAAEVGFNLATCIPEIHQAYDLLAGALYIPNAGALMFFTGLAVRRTYR